MLFRFYVTTQQLFKKRILQANFHYHRRRRLHPLCIDMHAAIVMTPANGSFSRTYRSTCTTGSTASGSTTGLCGSD